MKNRLHIILNLFACIYTTVDADIHGKQLTFSYHLYKVLFTIYQYSASDVYLESVYTMDADIHGKQLITGTKSCILLTNNIVLVSIH